MKYFIHLSFLSLLFSSPCMAQSMAEQQDARVIEQLISAGSDVSKPHDIDFFMLMPTEKQPGWRLKIWNNWATPSLQLSALQESCHGRFMQPARWCRSWMP